jgi:hypothetical protein
VNDYENISDHNSIDIDWRIKNYKLEEKECVHSWFEIKTVTVQDEFENFSPEWCRSIFSSTEHIECVSDKKLN